MKLHNLKPPCGSTHYRKRVGRGYGSGHGGTSTAGHKGHQARSGFSRPFNFEGGQMPLVRRLPKRGFTHLKKNYEILNLKELAVFAEGTTVTLEMLQNQGLVKKGARVKILGEGSIDKKLNVQGHSFSNLARAKIEKAGGQVVKKND